MSVPVTAAARIAVSLVLVSFAGCGVADAQTTDEIAMSGDSGERVLGKRAFDASSAGYAPFEQLIGESPQRTLARAAKQLDVLEGDLARMQSRRGRADTPELARIAMRLRELSGTIAAARTSAMTDDDLETTIAGIGEVQGDLDHARQRRILGR